MPTGVGDVPFSRGDIAALTATPRAGGQFADVLGTISAIEGRKIQQADYKAQLIAGQSDVDTRILELLDSFKTNQDESTYEKALKDTLKAVKTDLIPTITNSNAKRDLQQWIEASNPVWKDKVRDEAFKRKKINTGARADQMRDTAVNKRDLRDPIQRYEADNLIGQAGILMGEVGVPKEAVDEWMDEALEDINNKGIFLEAQTISKAKGYDAAVKWIMSQEIETDAKRGIISDFKFEATQQQEQLEVEREKNRDSISKLIRLGQSATSEIENSLLDEKEQWTWFERERAEADRLAKGEDIISDIQLEGELEKMAYDIWTGAVKKIPFDDALNKARFDERAIDDSAYGSLKSLSEREHKAYQAGALREAITHAETQLVTVHQSTLEAILTALETEQDRVVYENLSNQRKQELWNLAQYRKALNDWFKDNSEATAEDMYIASRKLLILYRRRTLADISKAQQEFEAKLLTVYPKLPTDKKILEAAKKAARLRAGRPKPKEDTKIEVEEKALVSKGKKIPGVLEEAQGFNKFLKSMPGPLKPIWEELKGDERLMVYRLLAAGVTDEQIAGMTAKERGTVTRLLARGYSIEKIKEVFNK